MRWIIIFVSLAMIGTGCATSQALQQELDQCQQSLSDQDLLLAKQESTIRQNEQKIEDQKEIITMLEEQVAELNRRLNISSTEQSLYNERLRRISSSVREFIKQQIRDERNFLTDIALEDFIGNPLIKRANTDNENNMIIDFAYPVPSQGQINGFGAYFTGSCDVHIKLLRPVGDDYIVAYDKPIKVAVNAPGKQLIDFDQPIIARKGDIMAYYFPNSVCVPFDSELGINSYFKMRSDRYKSGDRLKADDLWQPEQTKRKYSLNYYGIFYTKISESEESN